MTSPGVLETMVWIELIAGVDTQPDHAPFAGRIVGVNPDDGVLGSGPTNPGRVLGIYGWLVQPPEQSPADHGFVMSSVLDEQTMAFIRNIPAGGWTDLTARTVVRQQVRRLIVEGIPAATACDVAKRIHDAAVTNQLMAQADG